MENSVTKFFSEISLEMYLSHMVIFRVVEKTGFTHVLGNGWLQYAFTVLLVLVGVTIFSRVLQCSIKKIESTGLMSI